MALHRQDVVYIEDVVGLGVLILAPLLVELFTKSCLPQPPMHTHTSVVMISSDSH